MNFPIRKPVKALSWKEPWAGLMLPPFNKIETRTWPTNYRGDVLICASKKSYPWDAVRNIAGTEQWERIIELMANNQLSFHPGMAIAVGRLVDCRKMTKEDEKKCYVKYFPDLWCHVYYDVTPIEPFPWKGSLSWTDLTHAQLAMIKPLKKDWTAPIIKILE